MISLKLHLLPTALHHYGIVLELGDRLLLFAIQPNLGQRLSGG